MPDHYIADPDFVVLSGQVPTVVGDCKYKELEDFPEHSDVYQLVAHCQTIGCAHGILVYPGESPRLSKLGDAVTGTTVYIAQLRIPLLKIDTAWLMAELVKLIPEKQAVGVAES